MLTVEADPTVVERRLREGELRCPGCGGVLAGWGWARRRTLRDVSAGLVVRPRRSRCRGCRATHVLLLVDALLRRADTVEVIGAALLAKAAGVGHRRVAARLGRPASTVRGWLRRFTGRAEALRVVFTALAATISTWAPLPQARLGGVFAAAVEAIGAAVRFAVGAVSGWRLVCAVSSGRLLAPGWPAGAGNTSWPWAARY
jgi:hypothetical protein